MWLPNKLGEEQYCIVWVLFLLPRIEDWMSEATQQEQRTLPWCLQSPWCHARVTCHEDVTKRSRKGHVTISSNLSPVTENRISRLKFSIQQRYHREGLTVTVLASDWSHWHSSRISLAVLSDGSPILTGGRWKQFLCDLKCKQSLGLSGHLSYHTNTIVVKFCR